MSNDSASKKRSLGHDSASKKQNLLVDEDLEDGRKRNTLAGLLFGLAMICLALVAVVGFAKWQSRGLEFYIVFNDAKSLSQGDNVEYKGIVVGQVLDVDLLEDGQVQVRVRLDEEYIGHIHEGCTAIITNSTLLNVSGQKVVELYNPYDSASKKRSLAGDKEAPPLAEGVTIQGQNSVVGLKTWQVKEKLGNIGDGVSEATRSLAAKLELLVEEMKDIPESEEVKKALDKMSEIAGGLSEKGKEGLEALRGEWEEWSEQMGPFLSKWKELGKEQAIELWGSTKDMISEKSEELKKRLEQRYSSPDKSSDEEPAASDKENASQSVEGSTP